MWGALTVPFDDHRTVRFVAVEPVRGCVDSGNLHCSERLQFQMWHSLHGGTTYHEWPRSPRRPSPPSKRVSMGQPETSTTPEMLTISRSENLPVHTPTNHQLRFVSAKGHSVTTNE